ncbi:hypothetical protein QJS04_geneDACA010348 [Acorus gramineus]|uniref:Uncharacterized protein n=1 Tax=Acorus gramineus TaxID=55184 RepID=A0AAV9A5J3_ACOGR|nr:hypothetical protein QJS04_geneDACA010348 [Acorus gramineus]
MEPSDGVGSGLLSAAGGAFRDPPPSMVTFASFLPTPSPRRLSSCLGDPSPFRSVRSTARRLSWVDLRGRMIGAQEATSARTIGGGLGRDETLAWELLSPLHRVLIVAVVAVAANRSRQDQILQNMQQKLDELCEQLSSMKVQSAAESYGFCDCGRRVFDLNPESGIIPLRRSLSKNSKEFFGEEYNGGEMCKIPRPSVDEAEERRMSDLSDFCPSVASTVDIQLNSLAVEQDVYNLRKECEDKDVIIKELEKAAQKTDSKRIKELEDMIRRKNMVITKMKKDMVILEQKVIQLTRLRRPSYSTSKSNHGRLPLMTENVLYDMGSSSTSPSSSDSDSPAERVQHYSQVVVLSENYNASTQNGIVESENRRPASTKAPMSLQISSGNSQKLPLKENRTTHSIPFLRPRQSVPGSGDSMKSRKRFQPVPKDSAPPKRWV